MEAEPLGSVSFELRGAKLDRGRWIDHRNAAGAKILKRDTDFSDVSFSGIFVIHDDGLDWALTTQLVTELLMSDRGRLGTRKKLDDNSAPIPLLFTNPDLIWST